MRRLVGAPAILVETLTLHPLPPQLLHGQGWEGTMRQRTMRVEAAALGSLVALEEAGSGTDALRPTLDALSRVPDERLLRVAEESGAVK